MSNFITVPPNLKPTDNFFEYNPELKYLDKVSEYIDKYGEEQTSKFLWAIYMSEDPDSKLFRLPKKERRQLIARNFLKDVNFDWDSINDLIEEYIYASMSKKKRRYYIIDKQYDELIEEISEITDIKQKIFFFTKLKSIQDGVDRAEQSYEKERSKEQARGSQSSGMFG